MAPILYVLLLLLSFAACDQHPVPSSDSDTGTASAVAEHYVAMNSVRVIVNLASTALKVGRRLLPVTARFETESASGEIRASTPQELESLVERMNRERDADEAAIRQIGFAALHNSYAVKTSGRCPTRWLVSGDAAVKQDGFDIVVSQFYGTPDFRKFKGAVADKTIALLTPAPDVGVSVVASGPIVNDLITLHVPRTDCVVQLAAK